LKEAIARALERQPSLHQAKAQTRAAEGRVEQARSGYLPQVTANATYQRTTGNVVARPGATTTTNIPAATNDLYNYYSFSVTGTQLIYDFGQTNQRWNSARSTVLAQKANEDTIRNQTLGNVYATYFQAAVTHALTTVATENYTNQKRHFAQVDATVNVGMRPEIDRAQARSDVSNARVAWITAKNNYETAKAQLNQAIGVEQNTDYDISEETFAPVVGEEQTADQLTARALARRPEIVNLEHQKEAQVATLRAYRGAYGPSLSATAGASDGGVRLNDLRYNWYVGATLAWPLLQGGLTHGQEREAAANLEATEAQLSSQRLQIHTQIVQAKLAITASRESISSAEEAVSNTRERLTLAEGRYSSGVGNVIELSDAQVAYTNARAQLVLAQFNLAAARAQLMTALGLQ
jgi:outer membrane protein